MKVVALSIGLIVLSMVAKSQDSLAFKPSGGDWNLEVNFAPGASSPIGINQIRLRKFNSAQTAIRLGISLEGSVVSPSEDLTLSTVTFSVNPGFENHLNVTDRLSPYIGAALDFTYKTSKLVNGVDDGTDYEITGAWDQSGTENGFLSIGANVVTGCDFYIAKKLYLGTEVGFGLEYVSFSDVKDSEETFEIKGGSTVQFGPNFNGSLRLGYIF